MVAHVDPSTRAFANASTADANESRVEALTARLAGRYPQWSDRPFDRVLVLRIDSLTGWAAGAA